MSHAPWRPCNQTSRHTPPHHLCRLSYSCAAHASTCPMATVRSDQPPHPTLRPPRLTFGKDEAARRTKFSTSKGRRKAPSCSSSIPARGQCRTNRTPPTPASTCRGRSTAKGQSVRSVMEATGKKMGRQRLICVRNETPLAALQQTLS